MDDDKQGGRFWEHPEAKVCGYLRSYTFCVLGWKAMGVVGFGTAPCHSLLNNSQPRCRLLFAVLSLSQVAL